MSSNYVTQNSLNNNVVYNSLEAPNNTKGTLLVNNGTNVDYLSVGTNGKFLTAISAAPLGVSWEDKPSGIATGSVFALTAGIRSSNGSTTYSTYAYPSAVNQWDDTFCEGIPIAVDSTIIKTTIRPSNNTTWGNIAINTSFEFTLGYLQDGGDIGTTGTFTPYSGTGVTISVDNTNANTRNVIQTTANISIDVSAGENQVAVRCVNNTAVSRDISVFIFIRGSQAV